MLIKFVCLIDLLVAGCRCSSVGRPARQSPGADVAQLVEQLHGKE